MAVKRGPAARLRLSLVLAIVTLGAASAVRAAPEEIQVYQDDMDQPGHFGLDLHNNYVFAGDKAAPYPGGQIARDTYRFTPEFSYGITPYLEGGFYILTTVDNTGSARIGGEKLRLKFIAPRPKDQRWYWGLNLEIGRVVHAYDPNPWNAELKGIYGFNGDRWVFAINPNIDWTFSNRVHAPPTLEIDTKLTYKVAPELALGVESYDVMGEVANLSAPLSRFDHNIYAVADTKLAGFDLNLGVGWGLTGSSDGLVAKAIVGVPFP